MPRLRRRALVRALVVSLFAAACGSGSDDGDGEGADGAADADAGASDASSNGSDAGGSDGGAFDAASGADACAAPDAGVGAACTQSSDCRCGAVCGALVCVAHPACDEVLLTWNGPTSNADGTCVTNLAGFDVFWGQTPGGPYPSSLDAGYPCAPGPSVPCGDAGQTVPEPKCAYRLKGFDAGTWYFATDDYTDAGLESAPSNEATATFKGCP